MLALQLSITFLYFSGILILVSELIKWLPTIFLVLNISLGVLLLLEVGDDTPTISMISQVNF